MTNDPRDDDALLRLAEGAAATLAAGEDHRKIRELADHLINNTHTAERCGRLIGEALARYASRRQR